MNNTRRDTISTVNRQNRLATTGTLALAPSRSASALAEATAVNRPEKLLSGLLPTLDDLPNGWTSDELNWRCRRHRDENPPDGDPSVSQSGHRVRGMPAHVDAEASIHARKLADRLVDHVAQTAPAQQTPTMVAR